MDVRTGSELFMFGWLKTPCLESEGTAVITVVEDVVDVVERVVWITDEALDESESKERGGRDGGPTGVESFAVIDELLDRCEVRRCRPSM